jgi:hypothetical protein
MSGLFSMEAELSYGRRGRGVETTEPITGMKEVAGGAEVATSTSRREAGGGAGDRGVHQRGSRRIHWWNRDCGIHRRRGRRPRLTSTLSGPASLEGLAASQRTPHNPRGCFWPRGTLLLHGLHVPPR